MNDFLIISSISVTLKRSMLTLPDSNKSYKLDKAFWKTMTNYDFNVDRSNPWDQKIIFEFAKELNFNIKQKGRKSPRDESVIRLLKSPAIMAGSLKTNLPQNQRSKT